MRSAPAVRFIAFDILLTAVFAFECVRSSFSWALVHSTRLRFAFVAGADFFAFLAILESPCSMIYGDPDPSFGTD